MSSRWTQSLFLLLGLMAVATPACTQSPQVTASVPAPVLPPNLRPDLYPKWIDAKGQVNWPAQDGFAATPVSQTLPAGTLIDRFGSENGRFFSPKGEDYHARAVPYICSKMVYTVYRVTKPLHVLAGKAAPWFDEPGGAEQYETDDPAFKLKEAGAIEVVPNDGQGSGKAASPCAGS